MPEIQKHSTATGLPEPSRLEELVQDAIAQARALGADQVEAAVSIDTGLSVTVRLGETETLEYNRDRGLGLTVYFDHRKGSASTADFEPDSIHATVRAACDIARYTSRDECAGLADAERMATEIPDLDLYHPWGLDAARAIDIARECETAAREVDVRIENSEGATLSSYSGMRVSGNSHGFLGGYRSSRHSLSCAVVGRQDDEMQRDHWADMARDPHNLASPAAIGRKAGERTAMRLGARQLSTRQAPVIFAADVARGLVGNFINAISGGNLYRKSSFLVDHLGQQIFRPFMHIHEEPHLKKGLGSAPYDSEGVATCARDIVRDGVLQGYVLDSYAARKLGMETTGNAGGVRNLTVEPGSKDLAGLLQTMDTGLLVSEVIGFGVNILTGDYSRGVAGFWVEGGEIQYPVEEITAAGNLRDIFQGIVEVGNDVDRRGNVRTGSMLIEQMTIAGA
ncbi:MAG: metalloprotease PmbA [Gammaproteobacteria bacterium]|nr:MAG: metalloprotease PmbA [Gammaproteobacteria bacterium]